MPCSFCDSFVALASDTEWQLTIGGIWARYHRLCHKVVALSRAVRRLVRLLVDLGVQNPATHPQWESNYRLLSLQLDNLTTQVEYVCNGVTARSEILSA